MISTPGFAPLRHGDGEQFAVGAERHVADPREAKRRSERSSRGQRPQARGVVLAGGRHELPGRVDRGGEDAVEVPGPRVRAVATESFDDRAPPGVDEREEAVGPADHEQPVARHEPHAAHGALRDDGEHRQRVEAMGVDQRDRAVAPTDGQRAAVGAHGVAG
jgi:hypothetical protein